MSSSTTHEATAPATNDDDEESETIPTTAIRSSSSSKANDKENNIVRMGGYQEHEEGKHDADASTTNNDIIMNYPIHVQQSQPQRREDDRGEEEYERAVRRALTENEYVKQINSQLVAKLNIITTENEASKGSIHKLTNVCQSMKELIIELANAKDTSDNKLRELEKVASVSSRRISSSRKDGNDGKTQAKVVTLAKLEALEIGQRSMDEMVSALRESLDVACRERDEANEKVAELTTSLVAATSESSSAATSSAKEHATTQTSGGGALLDEEELWKGKLALVTNEKEAWVQKYNDSSTKLAELTMERDALQVKYDEMQEGMNTKGGGVETIFISKTIMEGEEDDWKTKYGELTEQLKQLTL